jgi:hypothetical protein
MRRQVGKEDIRHGSNDVEVLRVGQDVEENQDQGRVRPEARMFDTASRLLGQAVIMLLSVYPANSMRWNSPLRVHPGCIVGHVGDHHDRDDSQDQKGFGIECQSSLALDQSEVEQDCNTEQYQQHEGVLQQGVYRAEGLIGPEEPKVKIRVVTPTPQDQRAQQQHQEA